MYETWCYLTNKYIFLWKETNYLYSNFLILQIYLQFNGVNLWYFKQFEIHRSTTSSYEVIRIKKLEFEKDTLPFL